MKMSAQVILSILLLGATGIRAGKNPAIAQKIISFFRFVLFYKVESQNVAIGAAHTAEHERRMQEDPKYRAQEERRLERNQNGVIGAAHGIPCREK